MIQTARFISRVSCFLHHEKCIMLEPTYKQAISHGWHIVKKHPLLWFFGFFSLFLGQMGLVDLLSQTVLSDERSLVIPFALEARELWQFFLEGVANAGLSGLQWSWFIFMGGILVAAGLLLIYIAVSSHGALVHSSAQFVIHHNHGKVNVPKAWHTGTEHFWRIFFVQSMKRIVLLALGMLLAFAWYMMSPFDSSWVETLLFTLVFVLTICVGAIISFLAIYTVGYIVVDDRPLISAMSQAWHMFRSHWLVSIEVASVLVFVQAVALVLALAVCLLYLGQAAVVWAISLMVGGGFIAMLLSAITTATVIILLAIIGTSVSVFTTVVWTYLFIKMHKEGIVSRFLHSAKRFVRL